MVIIIKSREKQFRWSIIIKSSEMSPSQSLKGKNVYFSFKHFREALNQFLAVLVPFWAFNTSCVSLNTKCFNLGHGFVTLSECLSYAFGPSLKFLVSLIYADLSCCNLFLIVHYQEAIYRRVSECSKKSMV